MYSGVGVCGWVKIGNKQIVQELGWTAAKSKTETRNEMMPKTISLIPIPHTLIQGVP